MRSDTRARLTLLAAMVLSIVPVRAWERGEIDTTTLALRVVVVTAAAWAVISLLRRVANGYREDRNDGEQGSPRRRSDDRLEAGTEG
ncbi:MAG TPA: hypothetical protein VFJ85_13020 [Acidimicrobiales bacterium]|nr:hypothetical protein [Acidimicrobiales bacterium]